MAGRVFMLFALTIITRRGKEHAVPTLCRVAVQSYTFDVPTGCQCKSRRRGRSVNLVRHFCAAFLIVHSIVYNLYVMLT